VEHGHVALVLFVSKLSQLAVVEVEMAVESVTLELTVVMPEVKVAVGVAL
jgi:hypothetical protein